MSPSIVPLLVGKDFRLVSRTVLAFGLISVILIAIMNLLYGHIPLAVMSNFGFIMLVGPAGTCGIVVLMKTNVFEKEKATQPFIMSLPVTVKEFTRAKLWVNLPVFGVFWMVISAAGFYFAFGRGLFPPGAIPFVTMVFLGGFVAYTGILSASLLSQSLGITILSILFCELGTSAYLWAVVFFSPIAQHIWGPQPVWNAPAITIVTLQILVSISAIVTTLLVQSKKRDFI